MRKIRVPLIAMALVCLPLQMTASDKKSREEAVQKWLPGLYAECKEIITNNAKDPRSIEFHDDLAAWEAGHGLYRNWLMVTVRFRGMNSYGAVLEHKMTCSYTCDEKKGCSYRSAEE